MTLRTHFLTPLVLCGIALPSMSQAHIFFLEAKYQQGGPPGVQPQAPAKEKEIDEVVKDFTKMDGVFTLYRSKHGTADTIYMEVPQSAIGRYVMIQCTTSTGVGSDGNLPFPGGPITDIAFKMKEADDARILFVQPNQFFRSPTSAEGQRAIDRSVPSRIVGSFDIKARSKSRNSLLIEVTPFFKGDFAGINGPTGAPPNVLIFTVDPSNTYVDSVKNFPENMVIRTLYSVHTRDSLQSTNTTIQYGVNYNLSLLPEDNGYEPRIADTRIGYFTRSYQDLSDPNNTQQSVNYIIRWDLQKADPSAAVSEPKTPIVFWIDNAVPPRYRDSVRRGIELWNDVFEKEVGIKNALVVKQMPDDADWDIADLRYNVVRWTQNLPFAISLFRANPLTGQILNAGINMDAVFATGGANSYDLIFGPLAHPQSSLSPFMERNKDAYCYFGYENQLSIALAAESLEALGSQSEIDAEKERLVQERIVETVAHEMGHTLGLRHNFIASTARTPAELADPVVTKRKGVTASIMDYLPYNIYAVKHPGVSYFSQVAGEYDSWAIHYGYMPKAGPTPKSELPTLRQWASRSGEPGLAFETDQMTNFYDPNVYWFDMSSDPLNWMQKTYSTSRYLLSTLGERKPKHGESNWEFTKAFTVLLNGCLNQPNNALRFIGGSHVSNSFRGDTGEKPALVPIDADTQRRALTFTIEGLLSENSCTFPKSYYSKITTDPDTAGTQGSPLARNTPVFSTISAAQSNALLNLFSDSRLSRIENNEFRVSSGGETFTMAQLYRTVGKAVWSELENGHEISQLRRQLQRNYLQILISAVLNRPATTPDDAITLSYEQLQWLEGATARAAKTARGEYGQSHLKECNMRIRQALAANVQRHES